DLFQLPESTDPLRWLQDARGSLTASVVLQYVLEECRPERTLEVGPILNVQHSQGTVSGPRGVRVTINEMIFGGAGVMFSAGVRFSARTLGLREEDGQVISLVW